MPGHIMTDTLFILRRTGRVTLIGIVLLLFGGCATTPEQPPAGNEIKNAQANAEQPRWWYLRFRLRRGEAGETDSFLDALIADQILGPIIERNGSGIELWRFHRRWAQDATGHQFSLILFAPTMLADSIIGQVESHPVLQELRSDGYLVEFRVDAADPGRASDPAATSDRSWPPEVQREWPKFIMGASRMWLGLVGSAAAKNADLDLYERYRTVEANLDELWFTKANHAFFHHLSALFGYKPVRVIRRDVMTF